MQPRLNFVSLMVLVATTSMLPLLRRWDDSSLFGVSSICSGGIYGAALGWCWVTSAIRSPFARFLAKATILCVFSYLLMLASTQNAPWLRYATELGWMIVTQSVFFHLFDVPRWRCGLAEFEAKQTGSSRQFSIFDILLVTFAYGLLLGLSRYYMPRVAANIYWSAAIVLAVCFSAMATLIAYSVQPGKKWHGFVRLLLIGAIVGMNACGIAWMEGKMFKLDSDQAKEALVMYLLIHVGFVIAMGIFATAGMLGNISGRADLSRHR